MASRVNPKTSYLYHLKKASEPILLVTLVSSLALNLAVLNTQQKSQDKLHENRTRLLHQLDQESTSILTSRSSQKNSSSSPSAPPSSNLDSSGNDFYRQELLLAKRIQQLGLNPQKLSIHPRILAELDLDKDLQLGPKSVGWSEALFGNPAKAKSGMRKAVAGIRESMTRGVRRTEESIRSERQALEKENTLGDDREEWNDQDWENAFLKAVESTEGSSDPTPSIKSLLRSDPGSGPSSSFSRTEATSQDGDLTSSPLNLSSLDMSDTSLQSSSSDPTSSESQTPTNPTEANQGPRRYF